MTVAIGAALLGFALGSLPFGYLLVRWRGHQDVRTVGSGNIGATNVGRVLGRGGWAVTLLLDAGKGAGAVWLAWTLLSPAVAVGAAAGLGAIVGHCYTPWLGFRGGKGVATMLGTFLVLAPVAVAVAAAVFVTAAALGRMVSLASLVAAAALPAAAWGLGRPLPVVAVAAFAALVVLVRHRENMARILAGTEARIGGSR